MNVKYTYTKIRAWAIFPDLSTDRVDLVSVSLNYQLDAIPTAECQLAMGVDPRTGKPAAAHRYATMLERKMRLYIYVQLIGDELPDHPWPDDPFKVFDGYVSGIGVVNSRGAIRLSVHAEHWLTDLRSSSKFSAHLHSMSTGNVTARLIGTDNFNVMVMNAEEADGIDNILEDVWGEGVGRVMYTLAESDRMDIDALAEIFKGQSSNYTNTRAVSALNRFNDSSKITVVPLRVRSEGVDADLAGIVSRWTRNYLGRVISDPSMGSTLWDTLKVVAGSLHFSLVPNVEAVACAPYIPQIKRIHAYVSAQEYTNCTVGGADTEPIRALGLLATAPRSKFDSRKDAKDYESGQRKLSTDADPLKVQPAKWFLGYYDLVEDNLDLADPDSDNYRPDLVNGQFVVIQPPGWLTNLGMPDHTHKTLPVRAAMASMINPKVDNEDGNDNSGSQGSAYAEVEGSIIGRRFAQVQYLKLVFAARNGVLTGRLRFDVAPGSSIAVEVVGGKIPFYRDSTLYATVRGVQCMLDTTNSTASTTFSISGIRNNAEQNVLRGLAVDSHPMYNDLWVGTALVPGFEPINTEVP